MNSPTEAATFRRILGHYPTGICVITSVESDGTPVGMAVGSFTSVSLEPPLVGFLPSATSASWKRIGATGRFCVNVLAAHQEPVCRVFASKVPDKFAETPYRLTASGLPILDGIVAWIDCGIHAVHEAGDHVIVLGDVRAFDIEHPHSPLLFFKGGYGQFAA